MKDSSFDNFIETTFELGDKVIQDFDWDSTKKRLFFSSYTRSLTDNEIKKAISTTIHKF